MNPDQPNLQPGNGPIELKPGELARPIMREEMAESARSLIAELPEVHDPASLPARVESTTLADSGLASASIPAQAEEVEATGIKDSADPQSLLRQRADVNPLLTAAPVAPARVVRNTEVNSTKHDKPLPSRLKPILTAIATFSLMLFLFKLPIVVTQLKYLTEKPTSTLPVAGPTTEVVPADPTITIPKINIHAPVVYEPSVNEAQVQKALESGIDHYGNTPPPGQVGNSVFFGHSSNDWWEPGNYKFVFVLLDKLQPGDQFSIDYQSHRYVYRVTGVKVVEPTDLSVLTPTSVPTVTLITCTPPGTSWKCLVVTAVQIQPDPNKAATAPEAQKQGLQALPGSPSSIGNQFGQALSGIWHGITHLFGHDNSQSNSPSPSPSPGQLPSIK